MKKIITLIIVLFQLLFVGSAFGSDLSTSISNTVNSVAISMGAQEQGAQEQGAQEQECMGEEVEGAAPNNFYRSSSCTIQEDIEIYSDNIDDIDFVG